MPFNFLNLDDLTRRIMQDDIKLAFENNNLYYSTLFNDKGRQHWPTLLLEAAQRYDEHWLSFKIEELGLMKDFEKAKRPLGGYTIKHVPHNAVATLADGQFNRYYIMAVCKRAIDEGRSTVEVYRAKRTETPRPESKRLIGSQLNPLPLREELISVSSSVECMINKPNSGLSVKL